MKIKNLMILGTASGVGKSLVAAGFCRLFSDSGVRVAPFKAQNMSNNSGVTAEGCEMGRAQIVQAECARVKPHADMNPILLKPASDNGSQVVLQGKALGHFKAAEYYAKREVMARAIQESYSRLAAQYELLVIEGAGSPAEINLKQKDLVNFYTAELADARCLLVADIDRGGVFASVLGTLELLEPHERDRVDGIIINKFRGDLNLFKEGIAFLEKRTGKKVIGVLPLDADLWLEEEDVVHIDEKKFAVEPAGDILDIAVLQLPRMSNFTDFEILRHEPGVNLRYVRNSKEFARPDLLILPGTKATLADLNYLRQKGFNEVIQSYAAGGGKILGICGGFQMMGREILDKQGIESGHSGEGFGFFDMTTEFQPEKVLRQVAETVSAEIFGAKVSGHVEGYEIHMGQSFLAGTPVKGIYAKGNFAGTYFHGLFDSLEFRSSFLKALAGANGKKRKERTSNSASEFKERQHARLRNLLAAHLDLDYVKNCVGLNQPLQV